MAQLANYKLGTIIRYKNKFYSRQKEFFENAQEYITIQKVKCDGYEFKRTAWQIISEGQGKGLYVNTRFIPPKYEIVSKPN